MWNHDEENHIGTSIYLRHGAGVAAIAMGFMVKNVTIKGDI